MAKFEFLGRLADQFGRQQEINLPPQIKTVSELWPWLNETLSVTCFTEPHIRIIINDELAKDASALSNHDRIAIFPPVGGG